jgi:hypothetical protein
MCIALGLLDESSAQEISNLPIQDLQALAARLKEAIDTQDRRKKVLNEALRLRFEDIARAKLNQDGKDTGTVRIQEGGKIIIANFRKKIEWNNDELMEIIGKHPEHKEDIKCTLSIEERKYNNWPENIQKRFEQARTVKVSGYDFTINNSEED